MTTLNAVQELEALGYIVTLDGEAIRYTLTAGAHQPAPETVRPLLARLKAAKTRAMEYIKRRQSVTAIPAPQLPPSLTEPLDVIGLETRVVSICESWRADGSRDYWHARQFADCAIALGWAHYDDACNDTGARGWDVWAESYRKDDGNA